MAVDHSSGSFQERKERLRQSFLSQLPQRVQSAWEHLFKLERSQDGDAATLKALHLIFHSLKGSAASFGLFRISALAQEAEQELLQALGSDGKGNERLWATLRRVLVALEALALNPDLYAPSDSPPGFEMPDRESNPNADADRRGKHIYLCDDDPVQIQYLSAQLACFGYQVTSFTTLAALRQAVETAPPAGVIMDVMFPEGKFAGPELLAELNRHSGQILPSVFISVRDDFAARLQAVKAGGSAYCLKPVKTNEIVEFLDLLTNRHISDPFNILVVDDEPEVSHYHAMILEEAGMKVRAVTEPAQVLGVLSQFNADLVLMDLYMFECSGLELAQVLRQIPGHFSLPIIYVSSETDVIRQFRAMEAGADGFLTKPVDPYRLVAEVSLRAERMRALRSLMIRDSLTGLFNHNTITHYLEISVSIALRQKTSFCLAIIDVDCFKKVNDTYGHPVGDQVLIALSRGLRLSLRDSDLVGRYGGEEFIIVLAGVDIQHGKRVIDNLRQNFSSVVFSGGKEQFTCTFSGGVAAFPEFSAVNTLIEAADLALYHAKHTGRNRVEIANTADVVTGARRKTGDE